jgi:CRISPR-associated protein Cmr3
MVMGESHSSNFNFPPPVHTIEGAVRTLLYFKDKSKYADLINIGEKKGGFNIIGPMFSVNGEIFVPAPYSWYKEDSKKSDKCDENMNKKIKEEIKHVCKFTDVFKGAKKVKIFKSNLLEGGADLIKTKTNKIYWAKANNNELVSIGGDWINLNDINSGSDEINVFATNQFFNTEPHTGIALKENRVVRESHIYTFTHARLLEDVEIIFGIDKSMPIEDEEVLALGAEQRFGTLKRLKNFGNLKEKLNSGNKNGGYMSLSIVEGGQNLEADKHIIATGRIQYLGGWDLHKRFHKDIVGYYSAGTVFDEKFCEGLIPI